MPFKMIAALCTFLVLLATPILGQDSRALAPPSPCPTVFTYDLPGPEPGWWSGVVNLSTDSLLHSLWLDIVLDSQAFRLLHKTVEVFTEDFKNFRIENEDMQIQPGVPISLSFSVQYDRNDEIPRVQVIRLNGVVICNALSVEEQTDSRLKTNINSNIRPVMKPSRQSINHVYPKPDNRSDPGNISNADDNFSGSRGQQTQCGTSTVVSEWPWVVALYSSKSKYSCGGTLINHWHVITSLNCVNAPRNLTKTIIEDSNLVVHLGKQNLRSLIGVQIRLVQKVIIVSADYSFIDDLKSMHDVALLVLHESVTYTDWVRPVCLWPANDIGLDSVIGKKGWLVGWGYDDQNDLMEQQRKMEMPVVSEETCLKSEDYTSYDLLKTKHFYCAGYGEVVENVLCDAIDLGNGMVFKMGNSWYLRGHVSSVIWTFRSDSVCEPERYTLFTDLAKYVPWINGIVQYVIMGA